ncbi:MAG: hypothetical protein DRO12_01235 [Thermoprotei archaeon]|nr:MAG: hypothetical protein DRO12_01235 [Thermoprotei archaeon]
MNRDREHPPFKLLLSVRHEVLVALTIGLGVGCAASIYGLLFVALDMAVFKLPLTGAFLGTVILLGTSRVLVRRFAEEKSGSLIDLFLRLYHIRYGYVKPRKVVALSIGPLITVAAGGSVGVSGSAIFFGSTIVALAARYARMGLRAVRKLMMLGGVAGIAAVFRAPLSAMMFALEAPYRRDIEIGLIVPASIAAVAAYGISRIILGEQVLFHTIAPQGPVPMDLRAVVHYALIGVLAAFVSHTMIAFKNVVEKLCVRYGVLEDLGFLVVVAGVVTAYVTLPQAIGSGTYAMLHIKSMSPDRSALLSLVKAVLTVLTLRLGGAGGVFIPSMVIGAALGHSYASIAGFEALEAAMIAGMAGIFAGINSAPLTIIMFSLEVEGLKAAVPAIVASLTSYVITMHSSLHANQLAQGSNRRIALLSVYVRRLAYTGRAHLYEPIKRFARAPTCVANVRSKVHEVLRCLSGVDEEVAVLLDDGRRVVGVVYRDELEVADPLLELHSIATKPTTISSSEPLRRAVEIMEMTLSEVLVLDSEKLLVVTAQDLIRQLRKLVN